MITHLSLFSGIGGLDLAAGWAGIETIGQCEFADYQTKVLEKHWPDVPRWKDIRTLTKESFYERTGRRTVDIISGGFPCQPFSVAGKQKGKEDDRYLWPEMLRVIRELAPPWVIGENVPGIMRIAGRTVCEDLEREGYAVTVFNFEAAAVGAPHRRERVFFVANAKCSERRPSESPGYDPDRYDAGRQEATGRTGASSENDGTGLMANAESWGRGSRRAELTGQQRKTGIINGGSHMADTDGAEFKRPLEHEDSARRSGLANCCSDDPNTDCTGREELNIAGITAESGQCSGIHTQNHVPDTNNDPPTRQREHSGQIYAEPEPEGLSGSCGTGWWSVEPDVGRVADGVSSRVDRLKCLGNAVVPQQAYPIFRAIADIEPYWRVAKERSVI